MPRLITVDSYPPAALRNRSTVSEPLVGFGFTSWIRTSCGKRRLLSTRFLFGGTAEIRYQNLIANRSQTGKTYGNCKATRQQAPVRRYGGGIDVHAEGEMVGGESFLPE